MNLIHFGSVDGNDIYYESKYYEGFSGFPPVYKKIGKKYIRLTGLEYAKYFKAINMRCKKNKNITLITFDECGDEFKLPREEFIKFIELKRKAEISLNDDELKEFNYLMDKSKKLALKSN